MKRNLRQIAGKSATTAAQWHGRPLIDAVPWTGRLRHYAVFLLLIAAASPLAHGYLGVRLSAVEMLVHTLIVVVAVGLAILAIEALVAGWHRVRGRERPPVSSGGFLLRAAAAYLLSAPLVPLMHAPWAFTRAIMSAHAEATGGDTSWYLLPVALSVVYVAYQLMRKHRLERQLARLRRINRDLAASQARRNRSARGPEPRAGGEGGLSGVSGPGAERPREAPSARSILEVPSRGVTVPLNVRSVMHVAADQNYCHVVADAGAEAGSKRYLVRMTLSEAAARMPTGLFLQTHRSHLVNLRYVTALGRSGRRREVRLTNGERVPVSRSRVERVQARIAAFLAAGTAAKQ